VSQDETTVGRGEPGGSSWAKWVGIATAAAAVLSAITAFLVWWHPHGQVGTQGGSGQNTTQLASGVPSAFVGAWNGTVNQPTGVVTSWTITLEIHADAFNGAFSSPSLGCSGTLTIYPATGNTLSVYENVTSNPNRVCAQGANIVLSPAGDGHLRMAWEDADYPSNVGSADLVRN
jgi:hypothetical protein